MQGCWDIQKDIHMYTDLLIYLKFIYVLVTVFERNGQEMQNVTSTYTLNE